MLPGQKRGRHHDGNLYAVHGGDEGRPQRNLGFAEADVAADEAIHRLASGEIRAHGFDSRHLVFGFLVGEPGRELIIQAFGCSQDRRRPHVPLGSNPDKARGHVEKPLLELRLA